VTRTVLLDILNCKYYSDCYLNKLCYVHVTNLHKLFVIDFRERIASRFEIDDTIRRQYSRYNAVGSNLTVRLLPLRIIVIP